MPSVQNPRVSLEIKKTLEKLFVVDYDISGSIIYAPYSAIIINSIIYDNNVNL